MAGSGLWSPLLTVLLVLVAIVNAHCVFLLVGHPTGDKALSSAALGDREDDKRRKKLISCIKRLLYPLLWRSSVERRGGERWLRNLVMLSWCGKAEWDFSSQTGRKISLTPATVKAHYLLLAPRMSSSASPAPSTPIQSRKGSCPDSLEKLLRDSLEMEPRQIWLY